MSSTHLRQHSLAHLKHSGDPGLRAQEALGVDGDVVVQCRHHLREVVEAVALEHLCVDGKRRGNGDSAGDGMGGALTKDEC